MMLYDPKDDSFRAMPPQRDYRGLSCLICLIGVCIIILGAVIAKVAAADDPLCLYFDALASMPGVEVATWVGYPQGWQNYPETWDYEVFLPILGGGILQRVAGDQSWYWGYRSLETWTDQAGEHDGHHDFCPAVLIIDQ